MTIERGERGPHGDHGQTGDTGDQGEQGKTGETGDTGKQGIPGPRGKQGRIPIGFIAVTVAFIVMGIVLSRDIRSINITKADVISLKETNCIQKHFLVAAQKRATNSAKTETGFKKLTDLAAAETYKELANAYSNLHCKQ